MERIEAARATIAANKAARAARLSPLRPAAADQTPRMAEEEEGERAPLVEGGEAARSDEVVVAVGRGAVPDEQPPADDEKVSEDAKRRFRVRCCQSPEESLEEIQQQSRGGLLPAVAASAMAAEGGYAPLSGETDAPDAAEEEEKAKAAEPAEPIAEDATGNVVGAQESQRLVPLVPEQRAGSDEIDEEAGERAPLVDEGAGSEVVVAVERDAIPDGQEQHEEGQLEGAGARFAKSSKLSSMREATKRTKRIIVTQRLERDARRTCRARRRRCKLCCFELCERKVRGYRMPQFLQMLGGVAAPTADAWLDWGVTIAFYLSGDVHWFEAGLTINVLSGLLSGGLLIYKTPKTVRGPRALLGGRAGTVVWIMSADDQRNTDGVEKIQLRWEDDGTESPECYEDDAIKVSDLDEPLGKGSAVRHDGRRGTVWMDPYWDDEDGAEMIRIQWDEWTLSDKIKVSELEVTLGHLVATLPVAALVSIPGLAPAYWTMMVLNAVADPKHPVSGAGGEKVLKLFKAAELIIEAVPQSILQTYVGVAYGKFDPSSPTFSYLLPVSVTVSLLGAGSTVFGLEAEMRNAVAGEPKDRWGPPTFKEVVTLGSRYGIVGLLFRTAQVTALIFWISLLGCAEKGWAAVAVVLGVLVFGGMCAEAAYRGRRMKAIEWKVKEQPWGMSGYDAEKWREEQQAQGTLLGEEKWREPFRSKLIRLWQPPRSVRAPLLWSALHLALLGAMAAVFFDVQHVPNNYANKTLPMGGPGDPQHYDCHDRTSGLYPAYLASALCVVLATLYAALDPEHGRWREKTPAEKLAQNNAAAEAQIQGAVQDDVDVPLEQQAEALWAWVEEGIVSDGDPDADGNRVVEYFYGEIQSMAKASEMEPEALCELLGARWEAMRGPRAVLGGRGGTVISIREDDGVEKIQVRWEDDGTKSPGPDGINGNWLPDAIKVSDLDESLGNDGSAVRHSDEYEGYHGRRGTAATGPDEYDRIMVRWEDDGTLSDPIEVSQLELEVTVGREGFAAACAEQPESTAKIHAGLLLTTTPDLQERADAAVLEAKIAAVWRWADAVEDGDLGATELRRLADRVVTTDRYDRPITDAEGKYKELCLALGLGPRAVLGGRGGTAVEGPDSDDEIEIRWDGDRTQLWRTKMTELSIEFSSSDSDSDSEPEESEIKVSDLDEPLAGGWLDPEVTIGREAFAAACREQSWSVEVWFGALRVDLEEPGPGCLASATASWPLRILCIALAAALLAQWLGDDGAGSGSFA
eukprot:COSAG04_NODE_96_length_26486_cov_136.642817_15_plen_1257_part_00